MKWGDHVAVITSKAAKRLWLLKKLKRVGVVRENLAYFYQAHPARVRKSLALKTLLSAAD